MSRVIKLAASNVLRLTAVEITPEGDLVIVGGPNGAGKSSVLNCIAMALGGSKLVPDQPIHGDASEGSVEVDLGEFTVVRRFRRDRPACNCEQLIENNVQMHQLTCASRTAWGETRSSLVVKTKDNATYGSPQAMLDKLVSKLSFDPLDFSTMREEDQYGVLKSLVKLDTSVLDQSRKVAYDRRTEANREVGRLKATFEAFTWFKDVPADEVSISAISDQMLVAQQKERVYVDLERARDAAVDDDKRLEHEARDLARTIDALTTALKEKNDKLNEINEQRVKQQQFIADTKAKAEIAKAEIPDMQNLRQQVKAAEETNEKVRANKTRTIVEGQLNAAKTAAAQYEQQIEQIDAEKAKQLAELKFPIDGLSFGDGKVLYNNLPLKQASTAEQLRISVAIGIAVHPELKVLLIRRGSDLDSKSLAAVAEQATASGTQIWLERVAESKDGVSVMIEDGHVA